MVDGLIIPRTYNDYFSRSDPTAIRQLVAQFTDAALSATSENPVQNKVVKAALDVINAVIPTGASSSDKLALKSSVDAIDAKIPTQASAQNQLADKEFVNSSVSTNTANYISDNGDPFTSVAALEAYSGTVTNNDYAFVTGTDSDGNVYYDRYKATVSGASVSWAKEYRLNNSSFTAAQWAAISSGITAAKVAQYDAGVTPVDTVALNNMNSVTSNAVAAKFNTSFVAHDVSSSNVDWLMIKLPTGDFLGIGWNKSEYSGNALSLVTPTGYTLKEIINGDAFMENNSNYARRAMHKSAGNIYMYLENGTYKKGSIRVQGLFSKNN